MNLIFGIHAVESFLHKYDGGGKISVSVLNIRNNRLDSIRQLCERKKIRISYVDEASLNTLTNHRNHQGVVVMVEALEKKLFDLESLLYLGESKANSIILVLDGITDTHNLGAIIRTAECFGIDGIILPKNNSANPDNSTVLKVSSGAISYIPVVMVANISRALDLLKKHQYWIIGTSLADNSVSLLECDIAQKVVVVLGSEDRGMRRLVAENCDYLVTIPMFGETQSLNVSVASGVVLSYVKYKQLGRI